MAKIAARHIRDRCSRHFHGRMLDIGCGTKRKAILIGEFVQEHVGMDHEECLHDHSDIDIFGTAYAIPSPDQSYDCILSTAVLEHLEEPQAALDEAFRVCKPGAYAVYTMPLFWHIHEEPRDFFRYTSFGLRHLFEKAGFDIIEITPMSGFWVTALTEFGYYLRRFRKGPVRPIVDLWIALNNWIAPVLDQGVFRDERFSWMYLVVARRPATEG